MTNEQKLTSSAGYEGQLAIVTGGTRGMGLDICEILAQKGMSILAVYRSNDDAAADTEDKLKKMGADAAVIKADIGYKEEAERVARFAGEKWGHIHVLVNNAGIFEFSFLEEMTEEHFDKIIRTNLKSAIFMTQAVLPWMKKNNYGRIVNATSISGTLADVGLVAYASSKAGINMLTRVTSGELAPYGITVNAYAPGIIHTDMTDQMIRERGHLQVKQIPAGYFGSGRDAAELVAFLCSREASYITGELIGVDGGMMKVQNPYRAYEFVENRKKQC